MPARYTLKVLTEFASAHTLREYPGACARMHGHNWKVETEVDASALDEVGMGVDFKVIKNAARRIGERLDHRYLNEIEPFTEVNPTAENIAAYFYRELAAELNNDRIRIRSVTLWETDRACVRYTEDQ
ncbi:6-pyruvoyl-tetrahydropterin synthase [Thiohalobacter thiocyanaticus]|uniref:6-carboxy-5,6,7,8-tetrahydropterin synthase n=1 Tax=Thiohalobacter thiocyanaticus TaxID=585455 RepID=A0A1Z4VPS2_9GAMM|nr:6-carboxytetrahydropterin synthase QueD [Thiohalobacter thiocyanaticus]BAZ93591.1 6-pyruvoyl-tetrahydropterin synthase [Thiohalobacter thiocyanaticus]